MHRLRAGLVVGSVVGVLLLLAAWGSAEAQMRPASAEIVRVAGPVDVLLKGQRSWARATLGARLVEGDQVRALAAGSADLNLPDGSTILVAENTRFAVTKLDYDAATRDRNASFHLVAGKVRAQVSQAAVQLVRTRQSNFNISTPNGVAAVRGTILVKAYNPATRETLSYVFPSPGQSPAAARVTLVDRTGNSVTTTGGNFVRSVGGVLGSPQPVSSLPPAVRAALQSAQNQPTQNASELFTINVVIPTAEETQNLADQGGAGAGEGTMVGGGLLGPGTGACPGCGRDTATNPTPTSPPAKRKPRPPAPKPPICATPPCEPNGEEFQG